VSRTAWRVLALLAGTLLALALLHHATFAAVRDLLARTESLALLGACAIHAAVLGLRALRLKLLSHGQLTFGKSLAIFSLAQAGAALLPWRFGELLFPPLARWVGRTRLAHGAFWWLVAKFLDLWTLALAVLLLAAAGRLPLLLLVPAGVLLGSLSAFWFLARRRQGWRLLARTLPSPAFARGVFRVRHALVAFQEQKLAQASAVGISLLCWLGVVAFTGVLTQGMGVVLSLDQLLLGVLGAAVGAALPFAGLGNLGPLEAGFATALNAGGIATKTALALGFALHLWTLALHFAFGLLGLALLLPQKTPTGRKAQ